ncbi:undecaprenyl-phosphate glucose phosphotransferase [Phenylobacterium montanum]|uniref:Undecaprenyl-phosphate glucose phosphotransferase n=1 Tax=Phenylobacterium montanum TaxID=2823693 RepID=A0A975IVJ4_9CAUL|nr:undecaprenyl-phosphate glucose phosphotransferase [Caulobacter sp. S6]QUD88634.1 undecaprenyl-phosphate glucose phosphotransferase [Caulobacter sp. S6]
MIPSALHQRPPIEHDAGEAAVDPVVDVDRPRIERRGPMRPERLVSTRRRLRGFAVFYVFRAVDAVILAVLAAAAISLSTPAGAVAFSVAATSIAFALMTATLLATGGVYAFRKREKRREHLARVALTVMLAAAIATACLALVHAAPDMRQAVLLQAGLTLCVLPAAHSVWMALVRRWRRLGHLVQNVVVVGATENARLLIERAAAGGDIAVLGIFDDRHARAPAAIGGVPVLGDTEALIGHRIMPYVDRVVITVTASAQDRVRRLVERLDILPNDITLLLDQSAPDVTDQRLDRLVDLPLARLSGVRIRYRRVMAKRVQDLMFATLALALAAPLMAVIALAVKLDSPGPVFFRQKRQGFNNEEFVVLKFRSMRHDQRDSRAVKQVRLDDPRITRVGRFIRRTSLDELPQLFNVLSGEMSLVGPRPHAPGMKTGEATSASLVAHYAHRHRMKPGMTGWAAINGSRGPVDTPELVRRRVELDIAYIERQSFWFDLYIMLMTLPCLLGDRKVAR